MNDNQYIVKLITEENEIVRDYNIFDSVIGQSEACNKLAFLVQSHSKLTPFPPVILAGSAGLGKNYLAQKIAESLGRELVVVNCATCRTAKGFISEVLFGKMLGKKSKTILLDEAHELSDEITTILLTLLNPTPENKNYLSYQNWIVEFDLSEINVLFGTTHHHLLFSPLSNRCTEIYLHPYKNKDLYRILKSYLPGVSLRASRHSLSMACRGRARDAFLLAQNIKRYVAMRNTKVLDAKGWAELSNIFGIHEDGLTSQEIELLKALKAHSPTSCHNLSIALMVDEKNIESEIELHPKRLDLMANGPRGRYLTENGAKYLEKIT